ncbi:MAG: hypothetical protein K2Q06_09670 [Parvularculaceae bacterium]|nr:hypothetical protein [Parvularculaceae bacterium]
MLTSPYFTRLAAAITAALLLGVLIARPESGRDALARKGLPPSVHAAKPCPVGEPPLSQGFAAIENVVALAPVGARYVHGEAAPPPVLRVIGRKALDAQAPARVDVVSIAKTLDDSGGAARWSVRMMPCEGYVVAYDGLSTVDAKILRRAGPGAADLAKAREGGAIDTRIRLKAGDRVGSGDAFSVAVYAVTPARKGGPSAFAEAALDPQRAQCPVAVLPRGDRGAWTGLFGDVSGRRLPKHAETCRADLADGAGAVEGLWLTDSGHGGRTNKVASVALSGDLSDKSRLIFSFFGRLSSVTPAMFASSAQKDALGEAVIEAPLTAMRGRERINAPFGEIVEGAPYCYEKLRAGIDGPRLDGVLVLQLVRNKAGEPLLKAEAIPHVSTCEALKEPWSFTGGETSFYRRGRIGAAVGD